MTDRHIGASLAAHAAQRPGAPAILGPGETLSHAAFHRRVIGAAGAALRAGIAPGTVVGVRMEDSASHLALVLGLCRIGAPVVAVGGGDPAAPVSAILARAGARLQVRFGDPSAGGEPGTLTLRPGDLDAPSPPLPPAPPPSAVSMIHRSGGTTSGVPHLTAGTHAGEHDRLITTAFSGPEDRYLQIVSTGFTGGLRRALSAVLVGGAVIYGPSYRTMPAFVGVVRSYGATWTIMLPSHLRDLLQRVGEGPIVPGLRIRTGGSMLSPQERGEVMARLSPDLHIDYGANEVSILTTAEPRDIRDRPDTVGRALPGTELQVVDQDGVPVAPGTVGAIRARRLEFPSGYVDGGARGASRFTEGWFYTGDAGRLDDDGFLHLAGRLDDMINVGGQKVFPVEIQAVLEADPRVAEALVVGYPIHREGEVPVAAVVLRAPAAEAELRALCDQALGPGRAPVRIVTLAALPRTAVGKPDGRALRALLRDRFARGAQAPTDEG